MNVCLENEGRVWLRGALEGHYLAKLDRLFEIQSVGMGARFHIEEDIGLDPLVQPYLNGAKAIRFVAFNKSSSQNWALPWHQDRVIAVKEKVELAGFTNWSRKSGIWHCEPPIEILTNMIFARVYLDDVDPSNGSLQLALGSHKFGKNLSSDIGQIVKKSDVEICNGKRGDVLLVKALTLHRSQKAMSDATRRVMRIDYAAEALPSPLKWNFTHI